jgi:hypothetical protein
MSWEKASFTSRFTSCFSLTHCKSCKAAIKERPQSPLSMTSNVCAQLVPGTSPKPATSSVSPLFTVCQWALWVLNPALRKPLLLCRRKWPMASTLSWSSRCPESSTDSRQLRQKQETLLWAGGIEATLWRRRMRIRLKCEYRREL